MINEQFSFNVIVFMLNHPGCFPVEPPFLFFAGGGVINDINNGFAHHFGPYAGNTQATFLVCPFFAAFRNNLRVHKYFPQPQVFLSFILHAAAGDNKQPDRLVNLGSG